MRRSLVFICFLVRVEAQTAQCDSTGNTLPPIMACSSTSPCACPRTSCVNSVCVDRSSVTAYLQQTWSNAPNNVYATFSLWDKNCNPFIQPSSSINTGLVLREKPQGASNFQSISRSESFYGTAENFLSLSTARVLILVDISESIQGNIEDVRKAILSFLRTVMDQPDARNIIQTAVYAFLGGANLISLSVKGGFSTDYDDLFALIQKADLSCSFDRGQDCSTNLFGAFVTALSYFTSTSKPSFDYLIIFTDGTDHSQLKTQQYQT